MNEHTLLPGGFWADDGALYRDAWLRPLTGNEEEMLGSVQTDPAQKTTQVLARCLVRLGPLEPVSTAAVRQLLVGDRDALLLHLRRLTFGTLVYADLICPWPQCGEQVSLTFELDSLPLPESPVRAATHTLTLSTPSPSSDATQVTFRLPNGADQEELSASAASAPAAALTELLRRCIVSITPERDGHSLEQQVTDLTPAARAEIEAEMERLAPQLDRTIGSRCAECGKLILVPFDLRKCFFGELNTDSRLLYREVHKLAYNYHWSETEILAMSRPRRHTYLEVLAEETESLGHG